MSLFKGLKHKFAPSFQKVQKIEYVIDRIMIISLFFETRLSIA